MPVSKMSPGNPRMGRSSRKCWRLHPYKEDRVSSWLCYNLDPFIVPEELEQQNFDRFDRYRIVEENEVMYEEFMMEDAEICIAAFGIAARVSKNAVIAAREMGIKVGMIRPITLWPFPKQAFRKAADQVGAFISVELSMGQMIDDIRLAEECIRPVYLCNRAGGMIPSPEQVLASIQSIAGGN